MLKTYSLALAAAMTIPTTASADWSGRYAGGSFGTASNLEQEINVTPFIDYEFADRSTFGAFFGSRTENGNFVYGGEFALEFLGDDDDDEASTPGSDINYIFDMKGTAGTSLGDALIYGIVSISIAGGNYDSVNDMSAGGFGIGAGAAYKFGDDFSIGAEYLTRSLSEEFVEGTYDVTAETITLRAAYHF
ncbi:outer membrane beta-barrel protein [Yoonia sp. BS5-3]|uniref:Outer membrane beta-barrel protein n=1 Tax=Yoonia phaeophyticola TaxID=3137369 RepID=A0ABZ2V273_9RHOB